MSNILNINQLILVYAIGADSVISRVHCEIERHDDGAIVAVIHGVHSEIERNDDKKAEHTAMDPSPCALQQRKRVERQVKRGAPQQTKRVEGQVRQPKRVEHRVKRVEEEHLLRGLPKYHRRYIKVPSLLHHILVVVAAAAAVLVLKHLTVE